MKQMQKADLRIIGAGLAGSELAYQLAKRGYTIDLYEMRPQKMTPAHTGAFFAELVCSNSFRSDNETNAVGLLKREMRALDSLIMKVADQHRIPAGSALAVDRVGFSEAVTKELKAMPNIRVIHEEFTDFDDDLVTVIASGPLTSDALSETIKNKLGFEELYFYDAVAPVISGEQIDFNKAYRKSRYDKGDGNDYINCPMNKEEFETFYDALLKAEKAEMRSFEDLKVFEACMPIETMASRGIKTLLFGPLKPVGLEKADGERPYAVVQLRQDDAAASLYNLVGFQTRLKWSEQKRIIQMIPGLEKVDIVRYGVMHRNTFFKSPLVLNEHYQSKKLPHLFFAGQITGVEGYVESSASGLLCALNVDRYLRQETLLSMSRETVMGAMAYYISHASGKHFQPMNANFALLDNLEKDKSNMAKRSDEHIKVLLHELSR